MDNNIWAYIYYRNCFCNNVCPTSMGNNGGYMKANRKEECK